MQLSINLSLFFYYMIKYKKGKINKKYLQQKIYILCLFNVYVVFFYSIFIANGYNRAVQIPEHNPIKSAITK